MIAETELLERFEHVARQKDGDWLVRCRAHDDGRPSLHVTRGEDRWLLHCLAGCSLEDVCASISLDPRELFHDNGHQGASRIVATYPYTDESGGLLFEVVRFHPKDFRQRRRAANGDWVWKLGDTRRVLYRLPKVIEAIAAGRRVWIVEGEEDVHALERAGDVATCNPGGAGKWREEYSEVFRGAADVRVVADRDKPGRDHATTARRSLEAVGARVRVVEAAEGKDARDHLAAGRRLDEFVAIEEDDDDEDKSVLVPFSEITAKPIRWAWRDYVPLAKLTALAGRPKIGKGLLYSRMIAQVTRGTLEGDLGGPRNVIIVTTEDDPGDTIKPRLMAAGADTSRVFQFRMGSRKNPVPFRVPRDADQLARRVREVDAALIVIDPLIEFVGDEVDSHKSQPVRQALASLTAIAQESGCAILAIVHLNKTRSDDPLLRLEGAGAFFQVTRGGLLLGPDPKDRDGDTRVLAAVGSNLTGKAQSLVFEIVGKVLPGDTGELIKTAMMIPAGESDATGYDLLGGSRDDHGDQSAIQEARDFLCHELAAGPRAAKDVKTAAFTVQISPKTLRRAREDLGVKAIPPSTFGGPWTWALQSCPSPMGNTGAGNTGQDCESPLDTGGPGGEESSVAHDETMGKTGLSDPICDRHPGQEWRLASGRGPWACGVCHPAAEGAEVEWREGAGR